GLLQTLMDETQQLELFSGQHLEASVICVPLGPCRLRPTASATAAASACPGAPRLLRSGNRFGLVHPSRQAQKDSPKQIMNIHYLFHMFSATISFGVKRASGGIETLSITRAPDTRARRIRRAPRSPSRGPRIPLRARWCLRSADLISARLVPLADRERVTSRRSDLRSGDQ